MNSRELRQNESVDKVIAANFNGILDLSVRFGKTRVGLKIAKAFSELRSGHVLIITPSNSIKDRWLAEINKISFPITPAIASATQLLNLPKSKQVVDLIIVDEAHRFTGDEYYKLLNDTQLIANNRIFLTGSLPSGDKLTKLLNLVPVIDTITEEEAISEGWISDYIEYNIPLELTTPLKERYISLSAKINNGLGIVRNIYPHIMYNNEPLCNNDVDLLYSIVRGKYSKQVGAVGGEFIAEAVAYKLRLDKDDLIKTCREAVNAIENRNRLMAANEVKHKAVLFLIKKLNLPTIIFNGTIPFSDIIARELNVMDIKAFSIHSKTESQPLIDLDTGEYFVYKSGKKEGEPKLFSKTKVLDYVLECMSRDAMKVISTVNKLNDSITIPEIECVIITSGSLNPIQQIQRTGRGKSLGKDNKVTKIFNLYFEDFDYEGTLYNSRDKAKLINRQIYSKSVQTVNLGDI